MWPITNGSGLREPARNLLMRLGVAAMPRTEMEVVDRRRLLTYAGYRSPHAPTLYYGGKLGLAWPWGRLPAADHGFGYLGPKNLLFAFFPMTLGYYLPGIWLSQKVTERHRQIFYELPDALDLLLICMEAGLSFDMALNRVSRNCGGSHRPCRANFPSISWKPRASAQKRRAPKPGRSKRGKRAHRRCSGASPVFAIRHRHCDALKVYSNSMRTQRRQLAEEKGAKISIRLTFPMILLVLPALMLVILGPAFINLVDRLF